MLCTQYPLALRNVIQALTQDSCRLDHSLIPRPHPLTRRNGLVNQAKFLGLAHTFASVTLCQTCSKRYGYTRVEIIVVREVLHNNYQSHNLIGPYYFWQISPTNSTLFTGLFLGGKSGLAAHKTSLTILMHIHKFILKLAFRYVSLIANI